MSQDDEVKEWLSIRSTPKQTTATVSIVQGSLSARWSVKTYETQLKQGVLRARAGAIKALDQLREVADQLREVEELG